MVELEEGRILKDVRIAGRGAKGDPFVKYKGVIIFIRGAAPNVGERVDLKITAVRSNCAFGEVQRVSIW